ncbi:MAG: HupE/UreJ family protein [Acidobacteriota bacterium]
MSCDRTAPAVRLRPLYPVLLLSLLALLPTAAFGHATGESYVWVNVEETHLSGRFEIKIEDLESRLGLQIPEEPEARSGAVQASATQVQTYLEQNFEIRAEGAEIPYRFERTELADIEHLGEFARYYFRTDRPVPEQVDIRNSVMLDGDRFHRTLLCIEYDRRLGKEYGEEFTAMVFAPHTSEQTLDFTNIEGLLRVRDFVWQGVLHIWIGIDHVLFLIALLLTAVLHRRVGDDGRAEWVPVDDFKSAFWKIVGIVTAFTVAHSITLALAALDILSLPSRLVESIIALSIVLVAINNLKPKFHDKSWLLIFFFGLFHGMGFASVMGELPFRMMHLTQVILAFNIGVELGQLAIVAAVFPIIFLLRRSPIYRPAILTAGSILVALVALWWFIERAFGLG